MNHPILIMLSVVLLSIVTDSASAIAERHISTSTSDRATDKTRQRRIRPSSAITKELIKYYKRGLSVDVAMKTSAVVRKVVDKLQRLKMLPDTKRGFGMADIICAYCRSINHWPCINRWCFNQSG